MSNEAFGKESLVLEYFTLDTRDSRSYQRTFMSYPLADRTAQRFKCLSDTLVTGGVCQRQAFMVQGCCRYRGVGLFIRKLKADSHILTLGVKSHIFRNI